MVMSQQEVFVLCGNLNFLKGEIPTVVFTLQLWLTARLDSPLKHLVNVDERSHQSDQLND